MTDFLVQNLERRVAQIERHLNRSNLGWRSASHCGATIDIPVGDATGNVVTLTCDLPADHDGWHRDGSSRTALPLNWERS